jgi:hypothetical protein
MKTYDYELIDGGYIITNSEGLRITQTGNPVEPAVDGELVPVDDADRSATALAAIGELKAEDKRAGSMRSYGL